MVNHIKKSNKVVVIGASAGGIYALTEVVSHLPYNLPAAVILVQHLTRNHKTQLHEYLARRCLLPVRLAEDRLPIEAGVVYVSIPGHHLCLKDDCLLLKRGKPVNYVWPSLDVLFTSAAKEYGSKVIGVILTGTGRDGTRGAQKIKERGGVTIAQDEKSSYFFGMPKSAIEAGAIDYVLPLDEIAGKIVDLARRDIRKRKRKAKEKIKR